MGFDVAVNQSSTVGISHPSACLNHQFQRFGDTEAPFLLDERLQVCARHVFHYDEEMLLIKTKVMHRDDVRVGEVRGGFGFLAEALPKGSVNRKILAQNLNRHKTFQHQILGFIHESHSSRPKGLNQLITVV